jgi:hypothetical protein
MAESNTTAELLRRIERLEAIEDIKKLKYQTAIAADPYMDMEMLINLYSEDGIMEIPTFGLVLTGHDEIREFLKVNAFTWMFHCLIPLQVEIDDDGQSATASWYLWEAATVHNGSTGEYDPVLFAGAYEDKMRKINGEWKLTHTVLTVRLLCDYEKGWAENQVNVNKDWVGKAQSLMDTIDK